MLLSMSGEKSDESVKGSLLCGSLWVLQCIAGRSTTHSTTSLFSHSLVNHIQRVRTFLAFLNPLQISLSFVEISHLSFQLDRGGGAEFTMDGSDSLSSGQSCLLCLNRKKKNTLILDLP